MLKGQKKKFEITGIRDNGCRVYFLKKFLTTELGIFLNRPSSKTFLKFKGDIY